MARVFTGQRVFLSPVLGGAERLTYKALRVRPRRRARLEDLREERDLFSLVSWVVLYLILRTQGIQPFNPAGFHSAPWDVSFNTTSSFVSNTNWQFYGGETTLSYFAQMVGLTVQNFVSPAVGICRAGGDDAGHRRRAADQPRQLLAGPRPHRLLHPAADLDRRAPWSLSPRGSCRRSGTTVSRHPDAAAARCSPRARSPRRSAIKELGTNGGGFFSVNSSYAVREPQPADQLLRDAADHGHPGRP